MGRLICIYLFRWLADIVVDYGNGPPFVFLDKPVFSGVSPSSKIDGSRRRLALFGLVADDLHPALYRDMNTVGSPNSEIADLRLVPNRLRFLPMKVARSSRVSEDVIAQVL